MDWSAAGTPLVATRAVHFAATAISTGSLIFQAAVVVPGLRFDAAMATSFRNANLWVAWLGLAVAVISGVVWLLLQAASMSGLPLDEALTADVLSTVVGETQFGEVTLIRAGMAIGLAVCLACDRGVIARWLALAAALGLMASLAWTGHAGSSVGAVGYLHVTADALHLVASAAWIGGLVPLILLLAAARRHKAWSFVRDAVERFSRLGMISVATLLLTGFINAAILVGSVAALTVTGYGRLLLLKLVLFAIMLTVALINRLLLTPRLVRSGNGALRWLARNSAVELALGLGVFTIVAMLGTMHPAIHLVN